MMKTHILRLEITFLCNIQRLNGEKRKEKVNTGNNLEKTQFCGLCYVSLPKWLNQPSSSQMVTPLPVLDFCWKFYLFIYLSIYLFDFIVDTIRDVPHSPTLCLPPPRSLSCSPPTGLLRTVVCIHGLCIYMFLG